MPVLATRAAAVSNRRPASAIGRPSSAAKRERAEAGLDLAAKICCGKRLTCQMPHERLRAGRVILTAPLPRWPLRQVISPVSETMGFAAVSGSKGAVGGPSNEVCARHAPAAAPAESRA